MTTNTTAPTTPATDTHEIGVNLPAVATEPIAGTVEHWSPGHDAITANDPAVVLECARQAASALMEVLARKKEIVRFNGEQYIEADDWALIARFYGLTPAVESDRFVDYGGAQGFEATVVVRDIHGVERGRATSMCLNDEENWRSRAKYGYLFVLLDGTVSETEPPDMWNVCQLEPTGKKRNDGSDVMRPKKERRIIGEESVPLFQLRSMAQTRATGKALAMILRFVPMLANLKTTPAEELPGAERVAQSIDVAPGVADAAHARTASTTQHQPRGQSRSTDTRPISDPQSRRMFAIARECGVSDSDVSAHIRNTYDISEPSQLRRCDYDDVVKWIQSN